MPEPLLALLERTRAAVLSGDLVELSRLTPATESALAAYRPQDAAELAALASAAARNAQCLAAAGNGIRAARARLEDIAAARRNIGYDGEGRRIDIARPGTLARRF